MLQALKPHSLMSKPALPSYTPDFEKNSPLLREDWHTAENSFLVCGEASVGKTTFLEQGMRELAKLKIYEESDLTTFKKGWSIRTLDITRFRLRRLIWGKPIDSWFDIDGRKFGEALIPRNEIPPNPTLDFLLKKVDALVLVATAQQLLACAQAWESSDKSLVNDWLKKYKKGFERHRSGWFKKRFSRMANGYLLITQAGDVALGEEFGSQECLKEDLLHFVRHTGLDRFLKFALVVDSFPKPLSDCGIPVAEACSEKKHIRPTDPAAPICSAGLAMAVILKKTQAKTHADFRFLHHFA